MPKFTLSKDNFLLTAEQLDDKLVFQIEIPVSEEYIEVHNDFHRFLDFVETLKNSKNYVVSHEPITA